MDGILQAAELIQAAALAQDGWEAALAATANLLRGDQATLIAYGSEAGEGTFAAAAGLSESELRTVCAPEAVRLGASTFAMLPPGVAVSNASLVSEGEWVRNAYYNEYIRPLGGFHGVGFRQASSTISFAFASCRARRAGPFGRRAVAVAQSLLPHFGVSLELQRRLRAAEHEQASLSLLIDRLATGVIVTDASGRPLHVNPRAMRIAAEADGLDIGAGGLSAATPAATRHVKEAIAAVARQSAAERRVQLSRPSCRPALLLTLLPLGRCGATLPGLATPRVAIFIGEPDAPPAIDRCALADIYRLTKRETDIAVLLAGGDSIDGIAARLGLGCGTVRNHLKRVFDKTGVSSQGALVASLRGFAEWLR